jgi:hypothetical protein
MTRFSNYAKIIEPNSEYYGQVFEVSIIGIHEEVIYLKNKAHKFHFSDIQFCVTKDNEPVKIGEEYVCVGDRVESRNTIDAEAIYNFVEYDEEVVIYHKNKTRSMNSFLSNIDEHKPLHPTNKIKITAEDKEYWISREEFNRLSK